MPHSFPFLLTYLWHPGKCSDLCFHMSMMLRFMWRFLFIFFQESPEQLSMFTNSISNVASSTNKTVVITYISSLLSTKKHYYRNKKTLLDKQITLVWVSSQSQLPLGPCAGSGLALMMGVLAPFWWGFPRVWHQHQILGQSYHGNTLKPGFHNTALPSASLHPSTALSKLPSVH